MSVYSKLLLAALAALTTLAFAVGTAAARRIEIDDQDIDAIWEDGSERLDLAAGSSTIECEVTLLGSFHSRTINKTANLLVGYITHARVDTAGCTGAGNGSARQETLPWHLTYNSFSGILPNITLIRLNLIGAGFLINGPLGARCRAITKVAEPAFGNINRDTANNQLDTIEAEGIIDLEDLPESSVCDLIGSGEFSGNGIVRDLDGELVFVRLVA